MLETVACLHCRSSENKYLFRSTERVCKTVPEVSCNIVRCLSCGMVYLNPRVQEKEIENFYPHSEYYTLQSSTDAGPLRVIKDDLFFMIAHLYFHYPLPRLQSGLSSGCIRFLAAISYRLFTFRYRRLIKNMPDGKLLEFGFGAGDYLQKMNSLGWECWGIELGTPSVEKIRESGINAFSDLWDPKIRPDYFDWITSYHSLEHVFDPKKILGRFHEILKTKGRVYIGVPNFDSFAARLFRAYWHDLGVPIHPTIFSLSSIKKMLVSAGFEIADIRYRSLTHGLLGSLQIAINSWMGYLTGKKHTHMFLRDFLPAKLCCLPLVKLLDWLHLGDRIEIIAMKKEKSA